MFCQYALCLVSVCLMNDEIGLFENLKIFKFMYIEDRFKFQ